MAKILFLAHRVPFPPDKGDKIRAFNILEHLSARHDIWLGAGADDPADLAFEATAKARYRDACIAPLGPARRAFNMAQAMLLGAPISVGRFRHPRLAAWVEGVLRDVRPDVVFVYSSALAQYVVGRTPGGSRLIVDFVDADAEKWRAYAEQRPAPARWIFAREFRRLVRYESEVLEAACAGLLVSETERRLMAGFAPTQAAKLAVMPNGVDVDYFAPTSTAPAPGLIVFCGRMDYLPNIDAASWFAREILPQVQAQFSAARFRVVGARPTSAVLGLAQSPGVEVTGAVADVRPHLAQAAVVVAPLRIARGIQNKVLEGMAAGRPVVATPQALDGVEARPGRDVLVGGDPATFAAQVCAVLEGGAVGLAEAGRAFVEAHHRWSAQLQVLDRLVTSPPPSSQVAAEDGR